MNDKFDTEYLEVGDTFVGGPIEQSQFIGAVMGAGGEVDIHGDTVYIVALPKKAKAAVSEKPVEKIPETKVEEPKVEETKVEETKVEESKPAAKPGPKPKVTPTFEAKEKE